MTIRSLCIVVLNVAAQVLGCVVTLYGLLAVHGIDFRQNPVLSVLYCALPLLSLPACVLALFVRKLALLLAVFAVIYLTVYSALDWRTCAALGYCGTVTATILTTFETRAVLAYFAMAICGFSATGLDPRSRIRTKTPAR